MSEDKPAITTEGSALAKEFLLAEYERISIAMAANEELGERRIQILIGIATAGVTAVGVLMTADGGMFAGRPDIVLGIAVPGLGLILSIGLFTFDRLLKRDAVTSEYQTALNAVRGCFAAANKNGVVDLSGYDPFPDSKLPAPERHKTRESIGRLAVMMLAVNTWLAVVLGFVLGMALPVRFGPILGFVYAATLGLLTAFGQWGRWESRYKRPPERSTPVG